MVNNGYIETYPLMKVHFHPAGCLSNYSLGVLCIEHSRPTIKSSSKFNTMNSFLWLVRTGVKESMFWICKKLKGVKGFLMTLNRKPFLHISNRVDQAVEELERI